MAKGYIDNFQDLEFYFEKLPENVNTWNIYHGWIEGHLTQKPYVYRQGNPELTRAESWKLLEQMIKMNASKGGDFTIYFQGTAKGTSGSRVFFSLGRGISSPYNSQVAGVGNVPQIQNPYMVGMIPADEVEKRISAALEKQKLETRIANLEAAGEPDGFWSTVLMRIAENPNVPETLIGAASNLMNVVAAKVAGLPIQMNANTQVNGTPEAATEETETNADEYEKRCNEALGKIQYHFNDLPAFLEALSGWIEKNPDMAKSLFNQQMKK